MFRLILTVLLCLSAMPALAKNDSTLRVGMVTWFGNGSLFVAKDKGFFGKTNIDIKVIDEVTAMVNSFRTNQLDVVSFTSDGAVLQFANGMTGKVIVLTDFSVGADGLIVRPGITSAKELKGKTVGFTRTYALHYLLGKILKDAGLTMADIKQVPLDDPGLAAQGLFSGKVDAAVTWEPFLTQASSKKLGTVIKNTCDYPKALPNIFIVSEKALADHPEEIKEFIAGVMKALDFAHAQPADVSPIIAKGFNLSVDEVTEGLKGLAFSNHAENHHFLCDAEPGFASAFDDAAQFWRDQQIIKVLPQKGATYISKIGCDAFQGKNIN